MNNSSKQMQIAIIDDDNFYSSLLSTQLKQSFVCKITKYNNGEDFIINNPKVFDIVILDLNLSAKNHYNASSGNETLLKLKRFQLKASIIVLSSSRNIDGAISLLKNGAIDYIVKTNESFTKLKQTIETIQNYLVLDSEYSSNKNAKAKMNRRFLIKMAAFFIIVISTFLIWG